MFPHSKAICSILIKYLLPLVGPDGGQFVDAADGNFTIKRSTAIFKTGFKNVDGNVGVTLPALKKKAASPLIKPLFTDIASGKVSNIEWMGANALKI